jgi:hypothetical protein
VLAKQYDLCLGADQYRMLGTHPYRHFWSIS